MRKCFSHSFDISFKNYSQTKLFLDQTKFSDRIKIAVRTKFISNITLYVKFCFHRLLLVRRSITNELWSYMFRALLLMDHSCFLHCHVPPSHVINNDNCQWNSRGHHWSIKILVVYNNRSVWKIWWSIFDSSDMSLRVACAIYRGRSTVSMWSTNQRRHHFWPNFFKTPWI